MNLEHHLRVSLPPEAEISGDDVLSIRGRKISVAGLPKPVRARLPDLLDGRYTIPELGQRVLNEGTAADNFALHGFIARLQVDGSLLRTLDDGDRPLLTLEPMSNRFIFRPEDIDEDSRWRLSRFALLRRDGERLVVETPASCARLLLHDERGAALFATLVRPCSMAKLIHSGPLSSHATARFAIALLRSAAIVIGPDDRDQDFDDPASAQGWWEFHDLLFHTRSRMGRYDRAYGGTFHRQGQRPPPPLLKDPAEQVIEMQPPDLSRMPQSEPPFIQVLESRRSRRDYGEHGPTIDQLSEFLYRAARIQTVLATPDGDMDYSYRPHPAGGAIHELEIYPVVARCEGLEAGVYHYNPKEHQLDVLAPIEERTRRLLNSAWFIADRRSPIQIYLGITARFQRMQWKYQSMVYATILKNVGALYQTFYLVATAMGLAPVALGGGDSELFGEILGLDYYEECLVGEFLLGKPEK